MNNFIYKNTNKNALAFTLAETLVTLVIIGIVASLTIPSVIKNYQKHQTEVKVKKVYSMLNEAFTMAQIKYGDSANWDTPDTTTWQSGVWANKYLFPFLKGKRNYTYKNYFYVQCMNPDAGNGCERTAKNKYGFMTSDGVGIDIAAAGNGSSAQYSPLFVQIYFDINGGKKPNIYGKDIFVANYYFKKYSFTGRKKGFGSGGMSCHENWCTYVYYMKNSNRQGIINNCRSSRINTFCLDMIINNNWKIPDDYPW